MAQGRFTIELSGQRDRTPLLFSRKDYRDTVVYVGRDGDVGQVTLQAMEYLERLEVRCEFDRCDVEELGVARLLVPPAQMDQASNLLSVERRTFQASLIPSIGTNRRISGAVVNKWSFNLLAGYARGLEGFEDRSGGEHRTRGREGGAGRRAGQPGRAEHERRSAGGRYQSHDALASRAADRRIG